MSQTQVDPGNVREDEIDIVDEPIMLPEPVWIRSAGDLGLVNISLCHSIALLSPRADGTKKTWAVVAHPIRGYKAIPIAFPTTEDEGLEVLDRIAGVLGALSVEEAS